MKRFVIPITILAVLATAALVLRPATAAPALKEGTPKWEYKVIDRSELVKEGKKLLGTGQEDKLLTAALNPLGDEGWQLVLIDSSTGQFAGSAYVFRRPK
jgi:hypothetical protein